MGEHNTGSVGVTGSSPVLSTIILGGFMNRYKVISRYNEKERGYFIRDRQSGVTITPLFVDEPNPKKPGKTLKPSAKSRCRELCRSMNLRD